MDKTNILDAMKKTVKKAEECVNKKEKLLEALEAAKLAQSGIKTEIPENLPTGDTVPVDMPGSQKRYVKWNEIPPEMAKAFLGGFASLLIAKRETGLETGEDDYPIEQWVETARLVLLAHADAITAKAELERTSKNIKSCVKDYIELKEKYDKLANLLSKDILEEDAFKRIMGEDPIVPMFPEMPCFDYDCNCGCGYSCGCDYDDDDEEWDD